MKFIRPAFFAAWLFFSAAGILQIGRAEVESVDPSAWYGRMRQPWMPTARGFIRDWLLLGTLPKPPAAGDESKQAAADAWCDTDFLAEHGGETGIHPAEGMTHARTDGSQAAWFRYSSGADIIDLKSILGQHPTDHAVAYAFTTVSRSEAGPATLGIGSDDGMMIWVNGQRVHRNVVGRAVKIDDDRVAVHFKQGENTLLLKIENGTGGWGFACRILNAAAEAVLPQPNFDPALISPPNAEELAVRTDRTSGKREPIEVTVVGAGGKTVAARTVPRGETATFATRDWSEGAYEVRCTLALPFQASQVRHLPCFKGDATAAVARLLQAAQTSGTNDDAGMITAMLADLVRDRLGKHIHAVEPEDIPKIHSALMEFEELELEQSRQGSRIRPHGFVRLAYRDPVDDSPQFAQAYLPPGYDPSKPWPLVIYLHGYNPDNPEYVKWWAIDSRHHNRAEEYGVIYLVPHGRGNTGYRGIGKQDVLRCIQMANDRFSVDEDRVYLTGESMGGGGTWHVGSRHPELFAAIAPVFGGWDYLVNTPDEDLQKLTPLERFFHEQDSSFAQVESLLATPVFVHHGDADHIVDVRNSRYIVRQLQRWRYDVRYDEQPGGGHFDGDHWPAILRWLLDHRRQAHPRHVRIRSSQLKEAAAHWVRVEQRTNPFAFMNVDAEFVAPNVIRLDTENVLAVTFAPGGDLLDPARPLTVVWNETDIRTAELQNGKTTLAAPDYPPAPLLKRPELAGPMKDVQTTPFAIVLGTLSPDPRMQAFCERHAQNLVRGWQDWQKHPPRFFRDVDLTDQDMTAFSLILVGGPEANAITRKLWNSLPLRIEGSRVILDGHPFAAPDSAVQMAYPHPRNPNRYVLVVAATSAKGMFYAADMPDTFDFCIQDGRTAPPGMSTHMTDLRVVSGSFNHAWRVADEFLFPGDPAVRAASIPLEPPLFLDTGVQTNRLYLSDVLESGAVRTFQYLRRDANARGEPLKLAGTTYAHGLSVLPWSTPGSADWDLAVGHWQVLRGRIGLELNDSEDCTAQDADNTRVRFIVKGDGRELFRSELFGINTPPRDIEVPLAGVKMLTLVVHNEANWSDAVKSVDWADLQLQQ